MEQSSWDSRGGQGQWVADVLGVVTIEGEWGSMHGGVVARSQMHDPGNSPTPSV